MPRISVIIPAHNAALTLKAAVVSTLRAMPQDAHVLIYDDASTDDTAGVADQVARRDRRVRIIEGGPKNIGAARARNRLIDVSDSEFVAAMDADDLALPHRFISYRRSIRGADMVFAPIIRFGHGRRPHVPRPAPLSTAAMPLALFILNPVPQSTMFARRSALNGGSTYLDGPAEDYELWMRSAAEGKRIRFTALPTVAYRHHPDQATANSAYIARVRDDADMARTWQRLAQSIGFGDVSTIPKAQLVRLARDRALQLPSASDRRNVERLSTLPSAFPFAER